jgi:spermidine/putrescine transport system ATP-binding protein
VRGNVQDKNGLTVAGLDENRAPAGLAQMIEARLAVKQFGEGAERFRALDEVSIAIRRNEFFTLLGPSGCGKTTLLRLFAGFEHPDAGDILLDGASIAHLPPFQRPVNTVFQSYALFPHMTVAENVAFGLEMLGRPREAVTSRVDEMLRLVRMESMRSRRINQISGGQQQRVALARALAPEPRVLLLDEPLSALDLKLRREMQIELKRLQLETGITFVFVTHDQEEALAMSDRIAVMNKGRILQVGAPREIYERPVDRFVAGFIGETNFIAGKPVSVTVPVPGAGGNAATASLAMECGGAVVAGWPEGMAPGASAVVAVRPEHASLIGNPDDGQIEGAIRSIVYIGADTHVHLTLTSGESFTVRQPNRRGAPLGFVEGQKVGILIADGAAQVVRE